MMLTGGTVLLALPASAATVSASTQAGREYTGNYTGSLDTGLKTQTEHEYTGNYTGSLDTGLAALTDEDVQAAK
jgi:hypothetical protein